MALLQPKFPIVLGSNSPRRKQIMSEAGFHFTTLSPDIDETVPPELNAHEIPLFLADEKSKKIQSVLTQKSIVITSDTIVWHKNSALNKPENEEEAKKMLSQLSNDTHQVITGVCITDGTIKELFYDCTFVRFGTLTNEMIHYYVQTSKPFDKAGSYGIQEWIGMIGISSIEGSYYNVMGLPIHLVYQKMMKFCQ